MAGGGRYESRQCRRPWLPSMSASSSRKHPGKGREESSGDAMCRGGGPAQLPTAGRAGARRYL
eukprot:13980523-Heterocapsa_arctica.AAC.1